MGFSVEVSGFSRSGTRVPNLHSKGPPAARVWLSIKSPVNTVKPTAGSRIIRILFLFQNVVYDFSVFDWGFSEYRMGFGE